MQLRNVDSSIIFKEKVDRTDKVNHFCCYNCAMKCNCMTCSDSHNLYELAEGTKAEIRKPELKRVMTPEQGSSLKLELLGLKENLDKEVSLARSLYMPPELAHGLGLSVIDEIMKQAQFIFSVDDIIDKCSVLKCDTASKVMSVFASVFQDQERDTDIEVEEDIGLETDESH